MKNSNDTIGNRTRDLPACSAVPQPTVPPRARCLLVVVVVILVAVLVAAVLVVTIIVIQRNHHDRLTL